MYACPPQLYLEEAFAQPGVGAASCNQVWACVASTTCSCEVENDKDKGEREVIAYYGIGTGCPLQAL